MGLTKTFKNLAPKGIPSSDEVASVSYIETLVASEISGIASGDNYPFEASPIIVDNIYTTEQTVSGLSDSSVLVAQTAISQNGYYIGTTKQPLSENTIFVDTVNDKTAYYDNTLGKYISRSIRMFVLDKTFSTSDATPVNISIPVIRGRITHAKVMGTAHDSSFNIFKEETENTFHNDSGTHYLTHTTPPSWKVGHSTFSSSSVAFVNNTTSIDFRITGEAATTMTWHLKGIVHM